MYSVLLSFHSIIRWFVLASLLLSIYRAYKGWIKNSQFFKSDNLVRYWTVTILHKQLLVGICLYFVSPISNYFLRNYTESVQNSEFRFFGMEHSLMMLTAIVIVSIGSIKTKQKTKDREKYKTMAIWFSIGLILIFFSIPWSFSPLISRPLYRPF